MPPDLDDLINSIREEASRESALAVYEGTRQDDLVDEEIDERILNLLGLDDTFDIDYKTYMTLLKERMAAARMTDSQIPTEESELITEEFKRVKRKTGRFKIKTKKISVDAFQKSAIQPSKLLTGSAFEAPTEEPKAEKAPREKKVDDIIKIRETVVSIKNLLEERNDQLKDSAETERSRAQKARRAKREDKLEEEKPNLGLKVLEKAVAPVKGLFDRIVSGLVTLIAGRFLVKFLEWFADPDNKEKVDSLIEFLTDFAPAILGGFLLFGTGFGSIIRKLIGVAVNMTARLLKFAVPKLLKFVAKNPVAAAAIGVIGGAAIGGIMQSKTQSNDPDAPEGRTQLEDTMDYGGVTGDPIAGAFETGGLVPFKGDDSNLPKEQKEQKQQGEQEKGNSLLNLLGMTPTGMALKGAASLGKGAMSFGSSIKEKGLGNAAMDAAGGLFGNIKGFMDEKGITDTLMEHPLFKMGAFGLGKGQETFDNIKGFMDEKGITDTLMMHPLAKMGMFGMDKFMNYGKDPARDITGESGTDITGAGVDTQLISAQPGDVVINKEAATAMGPNYFDTISSGSGEKVSGAGPDTQMIATRPGEIVINRETVNAVGADHFLGLNRLFGGPGANKPKTAEVQAASGGGYVLPAFSSGGMVGGESSYEPSQDYKKEGDSPSNQENKKLLEVREKDLEKQEESVGGAAESTSAAPKTIEATIAREDAAVEAALAKENTATPDIRTPEKGTMPDMLGLGGLISGIGSMFGMGPQKQEEPSGGGLVGAVNKVMGVIQNPLSIFGMFGGGGEKKITDGNKGTPTEQEQKDLDNLAAKKEKLKQSQQKLMGINTPEKPSINETLTFQLSGDSKVTDLSKPMGSEITSIQERHAQLMQSTDPQRISSYDAQYGEGSYSKKLLTKLSNIYSGYQGGGFLGGIVDTVSNVASNPLVQTAASFIPGAAPIMTGMNMATGLMSGNPMSMVGAASDMIPGLGGITSGLGGVFGFQGGGMIGPSWMPWNWGKLVDKGRDEATVGGNAFGFNARYKNVTDPTQRRMLGLPPIEGRMGGSFAGGIFENTGIDIPGGTADRQLIKAQPGEYMLPADTVTRLGGPKAIDSIVARTDSNSTAAKLGTISKPSMAVEQPVMSDGSDVTTLPPIMSPSGDSGGGASGGGGKATTIPSVSVSSNSTRMNAKSIYGLVG